MALTSTAQILTMRFEACILIQVARRPDGASPTSLEAGTGRKYSGTACKSLKCWRKYSPSPDWLLLSISLET